MKLPRIKAPRRAKWPILIAMTLIVTAACATRPMGADGDPHFLNGLIDGVLAPISFVVSLFSDTVRMYAFPNIGRWYDFGFLIGIGTWGGSAAAARS